MKVGRARVRRIEARNGAISSAHKACAAPLVSKYIPATSPSASMQNGKVPRYKIAAAPGASKLVIDNRHPHKAVIRALCVHVDAGDVFTGVDGERSRALALACACASCVKGGYVAAYIAQKAMRNAARVGIVASDLSARIDAEGMVPCFLPEPAPETSKFVVVPSASGQSRDRRCLRLCRFRPYHRRRR